MARFVYQAILMPDEEGGGGYDVSFPDLPGCFTSGDDLEESIWMAVDAASTWIASKMKHGEVVPRAQEHVVPDGAKSVWVSFETSPDYMARKKESLHVGRPRQKNVVA